MIPSRNRIFTICNRYIRVVHKSDHVGNSFNPKLIKTYKSLLDRYWIVDIQYPRFHELNGLLVPLIYRAYWPNCSDEIDELEPRREFKNLKVLDIGCGGGIMSESLAKLNFQVTGIDPNPDLIEVARKHQRANKALIGKSLSYKHTTVEEFIQTHHEAFDIVILSEVLQYISFWNHKQFLKLCTGFCKNNGTVFISTINELFRVLPRGLYECFGPLRINWFNGISNENLSIILRDCGCRVVNTRKIDADFSCSYFHFPDDDETFNEPWYFMQAVKQVT